jgi:hypothetical protein
MWNVPYSCRNLIKFKFSPQIFETNSNTNVIKILPVGAELFHAGGRTDRRTDMTKFISVFVILWTRLKYWSWTFRVLSNTSYKFCPCLNNRFVIDTSDTARYVSCTFHVIRRINSRLSTMITFRSSNCSLCPSFISHKRQPVSIIKTNHGEISFTFLRLHVSCMLYINQNWNILILLKVSNVIWFKILQCVS